MNEEQAPRLYDVWRLAFEFDDKPGVFKERPVVIGAIDDEYAEVLVAKVTTHVPRKAFPGEVPLQGWKEAGLEKPSVVRCSRVLIVPVEAFKGQRRYGSLAKGDADAVSSALRDLGMTL